MIVTTLDAWQSAGEQLPLDGVAATLVDNDRDALQAADLLPATATVLVLSTDGTTVTEVRWARRGPAGHHTELLHRPETAAALALRPHPEGGWFRETWRSAHTLTPAGYPGERAAATGILFLLPPHEHSIWHAVRSDELWLWHRGGPLELTLGGTGDTPGTPSTVLLGPDLDHGHHVQHLVPAGCWQSARPHTGTEVLVSCVVAPGFDFADFRALPPKR